MQSRFPAPAFHLKHQLQLIGLLFPSQSLQPGSGTKSRSPRSVVATRYPVVLSNRPIEDVVMFKP